MRESGELVRQAKKLSKECITKKRARGSISLIECQLTAEFRANEVDIRMREAVVTC